MILRFYRIRNSKHSICLIDSAGVSSGVSRITTGARRLAFAFGRFGPLLRRVAVRLTDLNGPRGGVDKACPLAVTLEPASVVLLGALSCPGGRLRALEVRGAA